jgi:hypothetical protein
MSSNARAFVPNYTYIQSHTASLAFRSLKREKGMANECPYASSDGCG